MRLSVLGSPSYTWARGTLKYLHALQYGHHRKPCRRRSSISSSGGYSPVENRLTRQRTMVALWPASRNARTLSFAAGSWSAVIRRSRRLPSLNAMTRKCAAGKSPPFTHNVSSLVKVVPQDREDRRRLETIGDIVIFTEVTPSLTVRGRLMPLQCDRLDGSILAVEHRAL
jgi:hypothetical protein